MVMDQCRHPDGLRDKGGEKTDQDMLGTLWFPFGKGSQQFFKGWQEELGRGGSVGYVWQRGCAKVAEGDGGKAGK